MMSEINHYKQKSHCIWILAQLIITELGCLVFTFTYMECSCKCTSNKRYYNISDCWLIRKMLLGRKMLYPARTCVSMGYVIGGGVQLCDPNKRFEWHFSGRLTFSNTLGRLLVLID